MSSNNDYGHVFDTYKIKDTYSTIASRKLDFSGNVIYIYIIYIWICIWFGGFKNGISRLFKFMTGYFGISVLNFVEV